MAKSNALQSDLDFIKEYEELKIKQKLLIETLNKKKNALKNELLVEIASKLDFLVKIFQEATNAQEEQKNQPQSANIEDVTKILEKLDSIESSNNEKFQALEEKISDLTNKIPVSTPLSDAAKDNFEDLKKPLESDTDLTKDDGFGNIDSKSNKNSSPEFSEDVKSLAGDNSATSESKNKIPSLPPKPDFSAESPVKDSNQNLNSGEVTKKKKKWF